MDQFPGSKQSNCIYVQYQAPGTDTQLAKVTDQVNDCTGLREREGATVAEYLDFIGPREAWDVGEGRRDLLAMFRAYAERFYPERRD